MSRARRPLPDLPPDLAAHRLIDKPELAALLHISTKKIDEFEYGNLKREIPPGRGPKSFTIGRRRLWKLQDVLRWIDQQAKASR